MAFTLTLQPEFAYVLAGLVSIFITNMVLGGFVGSARKKYSVFYPNLYATKGDYIVDGKVDEKGWKSGTKFNQVQRGHQQFLETHADAYMLMFLAGLFYPLRTAQFAVAYVIGRFVYAFGYALKPGYRVIGELFYLPAYIAWIYYIYCGGKAILNGTAL